jgi:hypothetical protein
LLQPGKLRKAKNNFTPDMTNKQLAVFSVPVIVAALGYFVDIYDLLLFAIVRIPSLKSLGLNDVQIAVLSTT